MSAVVECKLNVQDVEKVAQCLVKHDQWGMREGQKLAYEEKRIKWA